jgi:hypothetical protein
MAPKSGKVTARRRAAMAVIGFGLLAAIAAGARLVRPADAPEAALRRMLADLEAGNRLALEQAIAFESLARSLAPALPFLPFSPVGEDDLPDLLRGHIFEAADARDAARLFVRGPIGEAWRFADGLALQGIAPSTLTGIDRREVLGDTALVGLTIAQPLLDTTLVLLLRMERTGDRWQLVRLDNVEAYTAARHSLIKRALPRADRDGMAAADSMVALGPWRVIRDNYRTAVEREVTNTTPASMLVVEVTTLYEWWGRGAKATVRRPALGPGESTTIRFEYSMLTGAAEANARDTQQARLGLMLVVGRSGAERVVGYHEDWADVVRRSIEPAAAVDRAREWHRRYLQ